MVNVSRREMLKGMGIGAFGATFGVKLLVDAPTAAAQTEGLTAGAFYSSTLGDFQIHVIRDGVSAIPVNTLVANAEPEEVNELLNAFSFPTGEELPNNFKVLVVNSGEDIVLFDTGLGAANGGQLLPTLAAIGIAPEDVSTVILSHWHPDHIGGVAVDGAPAFPNARYLMAQAEYDLLQSDEANQGFQGALATLQPVVDAGLLEFYNEGDELLPGIQAVAAPGHTPNHQAFLISSGDASLLNTVDAIIHPVISLQRTDWQFGFDADPELAIETRRALLDRIASEDLRMFGYHFPFPGIGVVAAVEGEENTYRFTPLSY